ALLAKLEEERKSKVITLIHRKESWPWPEEGEKDEGKESITIEDTEHILMEIHQTPHDKPIDMIVHTPGGLALAAETIAMALKQHQARVTAMVPFYALSGGTLIALAADEIMMDRYSVLGPLDPQIGGWPAVALIRLLERKPPEAISDEMLILAEIAQLSVAQMKTFVKWLLEDRLPQDKRETIAEFLTGGYVTHDTPISLDSGWGLGLNVTEGLPEEVYQLFGTWKFGPCERPCLGCAVPQGAL
ncbi:MAG: ATP-dependent Clp protease proteolytic subunit, partial [Candidatus Bipolaricaulia bacterium]